MIKILLFISVVVLTAFGANAQCTPDPQYTVAGVYPDSTTGMPAACIDVAYDETITVVVPLDTTIMIGPIPLTLTFDSIVVSSWTGLPPGFTYSCYDAQNTAGPLDQCAFEGATSGCISVTGNPTIADIGSYQQIINTDTYTTPASPLGGNPTVTVVDYYYIHIIDCVNNVQAITKSKFLLYPNPATSAITLNGLNELDVASVCVVDMEGKILRKYTDITGPALDMNLSPLANGMYFVKIDYNDTIETVKFIKE